jgi:hypothetical protein
MLKLVAIILVLAVGFGGGWAVRSYRNADACREAGGSIDTNRGICVGVPGPAQAPALMM